MEKWTEKIIFPARVCNHVRTRITRVILDCAIGAERENLSHEREHVNGRFAG